MRFVYIKLEDKASRIYVRDRTSFSTKDELRNVPINVISNKVLTGQTRLIVKAHGMVV